MRTQCDGNGKSGAGRVMKGVLRAVAGLALALGAMGVSMSMVACEADDDYFDVLFSFCVN